MKELGLFELGLCELLEVELIEEEDELVVKSALDVLDVSVLRVERSETEDDVDDAVSRRSCVLVDDVT